jgi:acetylornithine deacetylase/succinyl-diaminopimelate desuccinylase-like protein
LSVAARHGIKGDPRGLQGACDLVHFNEVGASGIVLGPGLMGVAHKPDEYVPEDQLLTAAAIYEEIAIAMLKP